eukprot:TRINITY_DN112_c1_g2_i1.p1 TRINITY_DN112_c1_g2~~TRINITY_DN112_c1_g2_i1.p1  ORF type:complete len:202 (+),score=67.29 TRINITY_DN112_c1_g2_i1:101-706(+)
MGQDQQQPPQYQQQQYQQQQPQYQQQQPVYSVVGIETVTIGKVASGNCCVPLKFSTDYPLRLSNVMSREEYGAAVDELNAPLSIILWAKLLFFIFIFMCTIGFFCIGFYIAFQPVIGSIIFFIAFFCYLIALMIPQYLIRLYLINKITATISSLNATYGNRGLNFRRNSYGGLMFYRRRSYLASTVIEIEIMPNRGNPNIV